MVGWSLAEVRKLSFSVCHREKTEPSLGAQDSGAYSLEMLSLYDCNVPCYNNRIL